MKYSLRVLMVLGCCLTPMIVDGAGLSGSMSVNQTSDTAAKAKSKAMNVASRQIFLDVVSRYADADALKKLINDTSDNDILNFISSSSVANEKISANAYSAKVTVNLDNDAIKSWLNEKNVQNWIPATETTARFVVSMVLPNGLSDWTELKRIARENNVEIETQSIIGNTVIAKLPTNIRTKFTAAVRAIGWKYSDNSGTLQIWK